MSGTPRSSVRISRPRWALRTPSSSEGASGATPGATPGVDRAWADAFVLELRLADVPGRLIGDALAEVASHCADSGETPDDAFGDPVRYARSLGLPAGPDVPTPSLGTAVPWVVQTLGLLLVAVAAPSLADAEPFGVTTGHGAVAVLLAGALATLPRWGSPLLRLVVRRPVVAWLVVMAQVGLLVAAMVLLDGVVARVPSGVAVSVGGAALVVGTLWIIAAARLAVPLDDPVTAPLEPAGPRGSLGAAALRYGPALLSPVVGSALVGTGLLM
jgi:hypothetical protein